MAEKQLDLKGLKCPLPVLKTAKAMKSMASGDRLRAETTDPLASLDMANFCNEHGHRLLSATEGEECMIFVIEKGAS